MSKYFMGIDVGTFETKGTIIDEKYKPIATVSVQHGMENPKPNFFEQDAEEIWWADVCKVSVLLLKESGLSAEEITALGVDVLGCDCLPVDENCKALRKAILYGIDARSTKEIEQIKADFGEERALELYGHNLCSDDIAPKILWIKNNEPDVFEKTYKFLTGSSYIVAKLTGNYVIDQFLAKGAFSPLYNRDAQIDEKECEYYCRPSQLAETMYSHNIAGHITAKASEETGLCVGTPVICGTGDSTSESISIGLTTPGKLMFQFGSSLFFFYCSDRLVKDNRIYGNEFTVPGLFSIYGGTNTAGTLTKWIRDNFYADIVNDAEKSGVEPYQLMAERIKDIPAGSDGLLVLPYFAGERCPINDDKAKGVIFGLTLDHTRDHILHAALEGISYGIRQNIQIIEDLGQSVEHLIAVGGGTKNPVWMQIVADVINKPVLIPKVSIGASYGEALMAALGTGYLKDYEELSSVIQIERKIEPNPDNRKTYDHYYEMFNDLYKINKETMHSL